MQAFFIGPACPADIDASQDHIAIARRQGCRDQPVGESGMTAFRTIC